MPLLNLLRNDLIQLPFYHDKCYTHFLLQNFHQTHTRPPPSETIRVNYLFFNFWIIFFLNQVRKKLLTPIWSIPSWIHLSFQKIRVICHLLSDVHITTTQTRLPDYKIPCIFITYCLTYTSLLKKNLPYTHYTQHI